jgi:hypothetical protein
MKIKLIALLAAFSLLSLNTYSQCKLVCSITMTETKTKKVTKYNYLVEVKTGWDVWLYTGQENYKYKQNIDYVFALVHTPQRVIILKAHKATGPDLIWTGAAPSLNCKYFPWAGFAVVDAQGNKGMIKGTASY